MISAAGGRCAINRLGSAPVRFYVPDLWKTVRGGRFLDISYDNLRTLEKSAEISYQEEGNFSPLNKGIEVSEQSFSGKA